MNGSPCNSCQVDLFLTLGYSLWVPTTYQLNDVVINQGNSSLYISTANSNTTAPWQPGALWNITTLAELIKTNSITDALAALGYFPWNGSTAYSQNQAVTHAGNVCVSSIPGVNSNIANTPGSTSDSNWGVYTYFEFLQRFMLNNI